MSKPPHASQPSRNTLEKKATPKRQAAYRKAPKAFSLPFFRLNSKSLGLLLLLVAVAALSVWLSQPQQLPLRQVDIEVLDAHGQRSLLKQLSMSEVQNSLQPLAQGNMLWLDVDAIQHRLLQLAWIKAAHVRRRLPATLHVQLQEQQAVAYWQTLADKAQARQGLLNQQGELFLRTPQVIPDNLALPRLHGVAGSHKQVLNTYQALLKPLQNTRLCVQSLQFDAQQNWRVWLGCSAADENAAWFSVSLGKIPIMQRWQQFIKHYRTHLQHQDKKIHAVDLRYEQGMAVAY